MVVGTNHAHSTQIRSVAFANDCFTKDIWYLFVRGTPLAIAAYQLLLLREAAHPPGQPPIYPTQHTLPGDGLSQRLSKHKINTRDTTRSWD